MSKKFLFLLLFSLFSCTQKNPLGTEKNPIKIFFLPSVDAKMIEDNSKVFHDFLEKNSPYKFIVSAPQSYIAVVEAFGTKKADVAVINSFGYLLAHEKYGVEAKLTTLRHGTATYQAQFLAHVKSGINSLKDLNGKKIAFVDPASMSGYLLPLKTLKSKKIAPKETVFAMKHDAVVAMIYQGQVDAGATFYSPPDEGKIDDARRLVLTQFPDVEKKVKIIALSEEIPNDPIVFRRDIPEEMKSVITDLFIKFIESKDGLNVFKKLYGITDLKKSTDADYEPIRNLLNEIGKSVDEYVK